MAALQPPKTLLIPFIDKHKNDCSQQGLCSLHCPHLCLKAIFPNPSPPSSPNLDQFSTPTTTTTNFSPVVIAIICILAGALLLLSYYTLISKYCRRGGSNAATEDPTPRRNRGRRRQTNLIHRDHHTGDDATADVFNSSLHEPWQWHVSLTTGLDEAQIKSITVCKYRKEDGLLAAGGREGTEHHCCSVCLSEFRDGESLRLLPKCSHAFHLDCIDTWLRTHSTCPLCRANILIFGTETAAAAAAADDGTERVELVVEGAEQSGNESRGDDERDDRRRLLPEQVIRRCVSMDHLCLRMGNSGYDCGVLRVEEKGRKHDVLSQSSTNNSSSSRRVVDTVKRSFSSGRLFYLNRHGNRACIVHPATVTSTSASNV